MLKFPDSLSFYLSEGGEYHVRYQELRKRCKFCMPRRCWERWQHYGSQRKIVWRSHHSRNVSG